MKTLAALFFLVLLMVPAAAEPVRLLDLRGQWKFQPGDDPDWKHPSFNDADWSSIFVPAAWEEEGFPGLDGFAWYRISFWNEGQFENWKLFLDAGRIDDADQVFLNGTLIGASGGFPPQYYTAYNRLRVYAVPRPLLKTGKNVLAIRVYDEKLLGGILEGKPGIYGEPMEKTQSIDLSGNWKLQTGDQREWKNPDVDDSGWSTVTVPLYWDVQGLSRYDGFAWYRKSFVWEGEPISGLFLHLGKVDDFDEVFLNGVFIGRTGAMPENGYQPVFHNEYQHHRAYRIPDDVIRRGVNILSVRVFDGGHDGGIYEGPVEISTRRGEDYRLPEETDFVVIKRKTWFGWIMQVFSEFWKWLMG